MKFKLLKSCASWASKKILAKENRSAKRQSLCQSAKIFMDVNRNSLQTRLLVGANLKRQQKAMALLYRLFLHSGALPINDRLSNENSPPEKAWKKFFTSALLRV